MEYFRSHPELEKEMETLCQTRRDEILSQMVESDSEYNELCRKRADASMALNNVLIENKKEYLLEQYSNAIFAQEVYELEAFYKQALIDTVNTLHELGLLK